MRERGLRSLRPISTPLPTREEGGTDEHLRHIKKEHGQEAVTRARKLLNGLGIGDDLPDEMAPNVDLYEKEGSTRRRQQNMSAG